MIVPPKIATLRKYGLSEEDWTELYNLNGGICPICKRTLDKPVIDHFHARGWRKMKAEKRKTFVRGICCNYCNRRRIGRGMNLEIAKNMVEYFENFEKRRTTEKAKSS
jgi:recombination endonuclease VII